MHDHGGTPAMGWPGVGPQVPGMAQATQLADSAGSQAQRPVAPGL